MFLQRIDESPYNFIISSITDYFIQNGSKETEVQFYYYYKFLRDNSDNLYFQIELDKIQNYKSGNILTVKSLQEDTVEVEKQIQELKKFLEDENNGKIKEIEEQLKEIEEKY